MSGAIPPLPNTPSWGGAQLRKAQRQLYFYLYLIKVGKEPFAMLNMTLLK
jgi:hypothetical protein